MTLILDEDQDVEIADTFDDEVDLAPTREITPENTSVFRVRAIVGYLYGSTYLDFSKAEVCVVPHNPIPVRNEDGTQIGWATVSVENRKVLADIVIDRATPERLDIETGARKWYPRLIGKFFGYESIMNPVLDLTGQPRKIKSVQIEGIELQPKAPLPSSAGPLCALGEPVL